MKARKKTVGFVLIFMMLSSLPVYAGDGPVEKLGRGLANIFTSPVEYLNSFQSMSEEHGLLGAFFGGFIYGTANTVGRILGGAYETVTFLIPVPEDYKPLMDPPTPIDAQHSIWGKGSVRE